MEAVLVEAWKEKSLSKSLGTPQTILSFQSAALLKQESV